VTIRRAHRPDSAFYVLSNCISGDRRLSWAARGLLVYLLSKPDHWTVSTANLVNETAQCAGKSSGRDAVYAVLRELIAVGYLRRIQERRADGSLSPVEYEVSEVPRTESPEAAPHTGLPDAARPDTANPTQVKTDSKKRLSRSKDGMPPAAKPDDVQTFDASTLIAKGVDPQVAAVWMKVRRTKRALDSMVALEAVEQQAAGGGMSLAEAVKMAAENSWQSFKAAWATRNDTIGRKAVRGGAQMTDDELAESDARAKAALFGKGSGGDATLLMRDGDTWELPE